MYGPKNSVVVVLSLADDLRQRGLLSRKNMVRSLGVSDSAFGKWGVEPAERHGRHVYYDVKSVAINRLNARRRSMGLCEDCGFPTHSVRFDRNATYVGFCATCNAPLETRDPLDYFGGEK